MLSNRRFIFVLVVGLIIFTRFFKLNWGDNFFFNPDENNMATSVMKMNPKDLDPHFYAYGQFPLYLTLITTPIPEITEASIKYLIFKLSKILNDKRILAAKTNNKIDSVVPK